MQKKDMIFIVLKHLSVAFTLFLVKCYYSTDALNVLKLLFACWIFFCVWQLFIYLNISRNNVSKYNLFSFIYFIGHMGVLVYFFPTYSAPIMYFLSFGPVLVVFSLYSFIYCFDYSIFEQHYKLFNYTIIKHVYCPGNLYSFVLLVNIFKENIEQNRLPKLSTNINQIHYPALVFAWSILFCLVLKEFFKKIIFLLTLLALFSLNTQFTLFFWVSQIIYFILLVSLLSFSSNLICVISFYFGFYVFGWIGSYQSILDPGQKEQVFLSPKFYKEDFVSRQMQETFLKIINYLKKKN